MKKVIDNINQIQKLYRLRKRIKQLQELEYSLTQDAITHIEIYGSLKEGIWSAVVDVLEKRCPHWKEELEKRCGKKIVESIITNTKPVMCKRLSIQKKGVKVNV